MTKTPTLADGESFVAGRSQETAKRLVEAAEAAGLKGSVRTTYNGYIFPSSILEDADVEADADGTEDTEGTEAEGTEAEGTEADENPDGVEFDPSAATVDEVKEYLDGADDTERQRVLDAETAGKGRKGILDLATTPEGAK